MNNFSAFIDISPDFRKVSLNKYTPSYVERIIILIASTNGRKQRLHMMMTLHDNDMFQFSKTLPKWGSWADSRATGFMLVTSVDTYPIYTVWIHVVDALPVSIFETQDPMIDIN